MTEAVLRGINRVSEALTSRKGTNWIVAYSGGKDSTALLKLFIAAAMKASPPDFKIDVVYCDTGVENVAVDEFVTGNIRRMETDELLHELGFQFHILKADIDNRFFVKIIGRGYPPPTNFFRWCTKELRIKPVEQFIRQRLNKDAIVALGTRSAESEQRRRNISASENPVWQVQKEGKIQYPIFAPIVDFSLEEVWDTVFAIPHPKAISNKELDTLYRGASGECPIIRAPNSAPCSSGRFGCWTCTVVRKDKSAEQLVKSGFTYLEPFLVFRNWLAEYRNNPANRWPFRRNGRESPGPFTLLARRQILERVQELEVISGRQIIDDSELNRIRQLWAMDAQRDSEAMSALARAL